MRQVELVRQADGASVIEAWRPRRWSCPLGQPALVPMEATTTTTFDVEAPGPALETGSREQRLKVHSLLGRHSLPSQGRAAPAKQTDVAPGAG